MNPADASSTPQPSPSSTPSSTQSRLSSLASRISATQAPVAAVLDVPVDFITPNPNQPRKHFDAAKLESLAASIRENSVIQPLVVRALSGGRYELIAGERRWRASRLAGKPTVPCILRDVTGTTSLALALLENLDREDMTPLDEALGVSDLVLQTSVSDAAQKLARSKQWISKRKRIADAPPFVREFILRGTTTDIEALYELAKLAEENPDAAQSIIAKAGTGMHLRQQIKTAAKPTENAPGGGASPGADGDAAGNDLAAGGRQTSPPAGDDRAPASTTAAQAHVPLQIDSVLRRDGTLILMSGETEIAVDFSEGARAHLIRLLTEN